MKRTIIIIVLMVLAYSFSISLMALPEGAVARLGKGIITGVTFSPDGKYLAVASSIGVWLYDAKTYQEVRYLESDGYLTSISFSPDGSLIASGSSDMTIILWDMKPYIKGEPIVKRKIVISSASGKVGSTINVQVSIDNAQGVAGGDINIRYDSNILTAVDVKVSNLISGMSSSVNKDTSGIVSVSFAGVKGLAEGSGALINITFKINDNAKYGTKTKLGFAGAEIYDESAKKIPLSLVSGEVNVGVLKGDINGDGELKSNDAILALRISSGSMTPDEYQLWAGDMNNDGLVRANDAVIILRKVAGLEAPSRLIVSNSCRTINISLSEFEGIIGEELLVPLRVDIIDSLSGGDIIISYDGSVLQAVEVLPTQGLLLASRTDESGKVSISFASSDRLRDKVLANIRFKVVSNEVSSLSFRSVQLYDDNGMNLMVKAKDGRFMSRSYVPLESMLLQNYPNPFNPET